MAYCKKNWLRMALVTVCCCVVAVLFLARDTIIGSAKHLVTETVLQEQTTIEVPSTTLEERFAELTTKVANLESSLKQSTSQTLLLRETFEHALAEVASQNDHLVEQAERLSSALAKVPGLSSQPGSTSKPSQTGANNTTGKVNINTATPQQLDGLPGIGPSYAERIVAYRTEHGNFLSIEDIQNVPGIGPATFAKIQTLISV